MIENDLINTSFESGGKPGRVAALCQQQSEEESPKEKQISEAEMQLKNMLQKQLDTKITLERLKYKVN